MQNKYPPGPQGHEVRTRFDLRGSLLSVLCMIALLTVSPLFAQESVVTGKVVDAKENSALPGVNVLVKGTQKGTVTDADGAFSVSASSSDVLIISFIGYETQEIAIGTQS